MRTGEQVSVGTTTDDLDAFAHDVPVELRAYPSDLHDKDDTKSICTSVNGVICHGILDSRPREDGDISRPSAEFEHTVVVTDTGADILTVTTDGHSAAGTFDTIGVPSS